MAEGAKCPEKINRAENTGFVPVYVILGNYYEHMGLLMALDERKLLEKGINLL